MHMIDPQANELITRINQDMRQAMKDRDSLKLGELRSLLARISNAEAVTPQDVSVDAGSPIAGAEAGVGSTEAQRKQLTLHDIHAVIQAEIDELEAALQGLDDASDYAVELREKIAAVAAYASA